MKNQFLTKKETGSLRCPQCGRKHTQKKYRLINVTEKPEYKNLLLQNKLFTFQCSCGLSAPLTYDSIYLDREKKLIVAMALEEDAAWKAMLQELAQEEGYKKRLVDNINDMKEKILIADNLLDDRIVEMSKVMLLKQLGNEMKDDVLQNVLFDYSGSDKFFLVFFEKKGVGRIPFSLDFYRGTEQAWQKNARAHSTSGFMKVDMEWASQAMFSQN